MTQDEVLHPLQIYPALWTCGRPPCTATNRHCPSGEDIGRGSGFHWSPQPDCIRRIAPKIRHRCWKNSLAY